jgi:photosystem II stability/assembly factor-like uncharacterized protein
LSAKNKNPSLPATNIVKYRVSFSAIFEMEGTMVRDRLFLKSLSIGLIVMSSFLFLAPGSLLSQNIDSSYFSGLKPRSIGPAGMSGRISCVDVVIPDSRTIYVGTATGGIWKSTDGGVTWKPVFDDQNTSSIGDITIDPSNPEIVWAGTGEANPRNSAGVGRGVFKTLDGGKNWQFLGLEKTEKISRLLLNPKNPDVAYVAAMGTTWGENPERGVFKTEDGGKTWKKVLYVDEKTGAADLAMDPDNPNRLLAAMWEHRRWPWFFNSGGPGSGLYLSTDGGETWKKLTAETGLPEGDLGRIGIVFSQSHPNIVYALIEAKKSALCRSEDHGDTWTIVNDESGISPRPFYYSDIRVHPKQPNIVYRLSSPLDISTDSGKSFKRLMDFFAIHGDFHELWIHPDDSDFMVVGGDGGIGISYDEGKHWNFVQNLPLGQYYHISVDLENPYNIYGGLQDNGSWRGPSRVLQGTAIYNFHWQSVGWGDGFGTLAIPRDSKFGYSMSQGGWLVRFNIITGEQKDIRPTAPSGIKLRFNWNAAIATDPLDVGILYYGSQYLHRSTDEGKTWEIISPDLTTNNPEKQKQAESGGLTKDVTHAEDHCTILTISPSPVQNGVIWVGTDDGKVQLTKNGGQTWKDLTGKITGMKEKGVPPGTWCPHIEASPNEAATAYAVFDDHRRSNWTPYIFMTTDFGETWKSLATPVIDGFVHVIREDPVQKNLLFLGTEFGLYVSFNRGAEWVKWTAGLPTVPIRDMVIHPLDNDLVIGTHGRSVYILDDIQPLREITAAVLAKKLHLFQVADTYQFQTSIFGLGYLAPGNMEFQGQNRPYGALITYAVQKPPQGGQTKAEPPAKENADQAEKVPAEKEDEKGKKDKVKIEILDAQSEVIRTIEGPREPGINRVNWDLRRSPFETLSDPYEGFFPQAGPFILPGTYHVKIEMDETVVEDSFQVLADPRYPVSSANRRAKYNLIMENGKYIEGVTFAYNKIHESIGALDEVLKRIDSLEEKQREYIRIKATEFRKRMKGFADRLSPPKDRSGIFEETELSLRLAMLGSRLESSFDAPTAGQRQEFQDLKAAVYQELYRINRFFKEDFSRFIQEVKGAGFSIFPKIEAITIKE